MAKFVPIPNTLRIFHQNLKYKSISSTPFMCRQKTGEINHADSRFCCAKTRGACYTGLFGADSILDLRARVSTSGRVDDTYDPIGAI